MRTQCDKICHGFATPYESRDEPSKRKQSVAEVWQRCTNTSRYIIAKEKSKKLLLKY